tara:strand:+ start:364 stop:522 length:159 start_codon:yes stop_codon:yes gene_type:complete
MRIDNEYNAFYYYKGYLLGDLPPKFAYIYDENKETFGISDWFNYKGLTWVKE